MSINPENLVRVNAGIVRSKLPKNRFEKSTTKALLIFTADVLVYLISMWAIILVPFWTIKIALIPLNGLFIGSLFIIGHDACHGSYVSHKWLNHLLGRLALMPSLNPFSSWEVSHNQFHHGYTNFKLNDVYVPLSKNEYDSLSSLGKFVQRFYRTPVGIVFYYQLNYWWHQMIFPREANRQRMDMRVFLLDLSLVGGYLALKILLLFWFSPILADYFQVAPQPFWLNLLIGLILPFSVWITLYVFVTVLQHTHEQVPWFDKKTEWNFFKSQVESSVYISTPGLIKTVTNNVFEHAAHHVDVRIPLYNLASSQKALMQEYPLHFRSQKGFLLAMFRTMRICKLYDYDNHCWLDFEGKITSKIELINNG